MTCPPPGFWGMVGVGLALGLSLTGIGVMLYLIDKGESNL